jgi:predicted Na+-dependent transporter
MNLIPRWSTLTARFDALEAVLSRRASMLTFLVIRFLLMSAMVVGFSWYAFDLHP